MTRHFCSARLWVHTTLSGWMLVYLAICEIHCRWICDGILNLVQNEINSEYLDLDNITKTCILTLRL
jgi:hypothetical protein